MKLLAFTSSLRKDSTNLKLVRLAAEIARGQGVEVDLADFHDFDAPSHDQDLQEKDFPAGTLRFGERLQAADGLLLSLPEYNFSIPGNFKNAVDWVSRLKPMPLRGRSALLLSASIGAIGGIRGLWQSLIPLEGLGVFVYPDMFTPPHSHRAFDGEGRLKAPPPGPPGENRVRIPESSGPFEGPPLNAFVWLGRPRRFKINGG